MRNIIKSSSEVAEAVNPKISATKDTLSISKWVQQHIKGLEVQCNPRVLGLFESSL